MNSRIEGTWTGWDGSTVIKLVNGSVWEQAEYYYHYQYKYRPEVIVEGNKMHVEGCRERSGYAASAEDRGAPYTRLHVTY